MGYEVTVDLITTVDEDGSVLDTVTRPLREIPGGSFGINFRREILPLHAFNGISGHVHLEGQKFDPDQCPVFEGELRLDQRTVVRGAIDFSGHYDYAFFSCGEETLWTILNDIEELGIDIGKFGESVKAASNGKFYDRWARLVGWKQSASDLANLITNVDESNSGYSVVFDDVIERTTTDARTAAQPKSRKSKLPKPKAPASAPTNDLLALSRNTDRLIQGLKSANWSSHELNELSDRLAKHGVKAVKNNSDVPDDQWLENVSIERAVIIGEWSKRRLEILSGELNSQLKKAKDELADLTRRYNAKQDEFARLRDRPPAGDTRESPGLRKEIETLEGQLHAARLEQEIWLKEHESVSDELDDVREQLVSAMSQVDQWKSLAGKANAGSETVGEFIGTLLPNIELLRDSESFLSFQLTDRSHVLNDLKLLNDSGGHHRAKALSGIRGWAEIHFSTGQADDGRLYYRKVENKIRAMLSWKRDQDRVIKQLRRI